MLSVRQTDNLFLFVGTDYPPLVNWTAFLALEYAIRTYVRYEFYVDVGGWFRYIEPSLVSFIIASGVFSAA